jgi:hypothetical protein
MLFLIEYDRSRGTVLSMKTFQDTERALAEDTKLGMELARNKDGVQQEVVLLEASNEDALRRTHRRYFENLAELARSSSSSTGSDK